MGFGLVIFGLEVRTPSGARILHIPELEIAAGECVGISGPSGAGKSTLIFAMAGLADLAGGQLLWNELDVVGMSSSARAAFRRDHVGLIFQDFMLFEELSALENASLAGTFRAPTQRKAVVDRAKTLLGKLKVDFGGRTVETFSGGERQRVAIARALAHNPGVILADEPTASLERSTADKVIEELIALVRAERRTLVVVSHDLNVLDRMDRVLTITDGKLLADGAI